MNGVAVMNLTELKQKPAAELVDVAQSVGIPAEGMALILGVDRFLDMCRTTVNVSGDLVMAALVTGAPSRAPA